MTEQVLCQCGCGGYVDIGNAYIDGHLESATESCWTLQPPIRYCVCGCGTEAMEHSDYAYGCTPIPESNRFWENKSCPLYLGVYVAETVLSKAFKNVERMPIHNPGYDFKCNHGKLIDVKCACPFIQGGEKLPRWKFNIGKNTTADFFLCLAFDNREDLNPVKIWLLPGKLINKLTTVSISERSFDKWKEYELDIDKVVMACDTMKRDGVN